MMRGRKKEVCWFWKIYLQLYGDNWFNFGILDEVERRSGETYLYHYNYNKTFSACPLILLGTPTPYVGQYAFTVCVSNIFHLKGCPKASSPYLLWDSKKGVVGITSLSHFSFSHIYCNCFMQSWFLRCLWEVVVWYCA